MKEKPIILVIEDDHDLQDIYLDQFQTAGFEVIQAFDGAQAVDLLEEDRKIDLILADIMLPKISGYEVLSEIRQNALTKDIPVIVVSALASDSDREHSSMLGANLYVTKGEMVLRDLIEQARRYVGI